VLPNPAELWPDAVQIRDAVMAPRVWPGWWVRVDRGAVAQPGDLVLVRIAGDVTVRELDEWGGRRWVHPHCAPVGMLVGPGVEILGVVRSVVDAP